MQRPAISPALARAGRGFLALVCLYILLLPLAQAHADSIKVNFQSRAGTTPAGYLPDFGRAFTDDQLHDLSYGWVTPGSGTPLDLVGNGGERFRPRVARQLRGFMHMQGDDAPRFVRHAEPGAWELALPDGTYAVTVGAGDDWRSREGASEHTINVEGSTAIDRFKPTAAQEYAQATVLTWVEDGRLTLDALRGTNTKIGYVDVTPAPGEDGRPAVTGVDPANGATGVQRDTGIAATVHLPTVGAGVDPATLTPSTVKVVRTIDGAAVPANLNTSGGGDVIVAQPTALLDANTSYRFEVTSGVKDTSGAAFLPYNVTFTTGSEPSGGGGSVAFEKVALPTATGHPFTSLTIGPDNKLYAATIEGEIVRFALNTDGTTGASEVISSVRTANGGAMRMIIGLAFDPASTPDDLVLWVSNTAYAFNNGPDWTGKISRLSGPALATVQDYVIGLPRSFKDHLTNSLAFGPDGALYATQGSNTAMGAPDSAWGMRNEHLLTAAVLRVDLGSIAAPPLDVKTEEGGTYDPFAPAAPLKIFGSGVRNAYDLVWHTNGQLYVPTNGSAAGGNTPATTTPLPAACAARVDSAQNGAYTGPQVPGITNVTSTQNDFLFRVVQNGFYGHPNPRRCEWVLNGGNPTSGTDTAQVSQYPVGTQPDRNWRGSAFNFANNKSPDGAIEYRNNAFGGLLQGKLLVARYSTGDDIISLTPGGPNLDIVASETGMTGMTGFTDPLDLTENRANGQLYVSEYGANRITLLRPLGSSLSAAAASSRTEPTRARRVPPGSGDQAGTPAPRRKHSPRPDHRAARPDRP